jgi:hypothetical protein
VLNVVLILVPIVVIDAIAATPYVPHDIVGFVLGDVGLRPYELTTATASISIMKSGPARRTVVLVGVATPK